MAPTCCVPSREIPAATRRFPIRLRSTFPTRCPAAWCWRWVSTKAREPPRPTFPETATTARSAGPPGRPAENSGTLLSFNGTNGQVIVPDRASLDLTTGMTLEAWVRPSVVISAWRDVIYKADDIYYLEGSSFQAGGVPAMGGTFSANPLYGTGSPAGEYLDAPGRHV